jgi:hypothetical protein
VAHITNIKVAEKNAPMIMEEVRSVCWSWRQKVLQGQPLDDLTAQLKRESMNMATRLLFSSRYGTQLPEDYQTLKHSVEYIFQNLSAGNPSDMVPALRVLPNPFLTEFAGVVKKRDEVLERIINAHRAEFNQLRKEGKMLTRAQSRDICDLFFWDQTEGYDSVDSKTGAVRCFLRVAFLCRWFERLYCDDPLIEFCYRLGGLQNRCGTLSCFRVGSVGRLYCDFPLIELGNNLAIHL